MKYIKNLNFKNQAFVIISTIVKFTFEETYIIIIQILFVLFNKRLTVNYLVVEYIFLALNIFTGMIIGSPRPFWILFDINPIFMCFREFNLPSIQIGVTTFSYFWFFINLKSKKSNITTFVKILLFTGWFIFVFSSSFISLLNLQIYLFQILFTISWSLVLIFLFWFTRKLLFNQRISYFKNNDKAFRKLKFKLFISVCFFCFMMLLFYSSSKSSFSIEEITLKSLDNCNVNPTLFGKTQQFLNFSILYGLIGSLTGFNFASKKVKKTKNDNEIEDKELMLKNEQPQSKCTNCLRSIKMYASYLLCFILCCSLIVLHNILKEFILVLVNKFTVYLLSSFVYFFISYLITYSITKLVVNI